MKDQALGRIVEELKRLGFVKAIIMFGSQARKRSLPTSDVDICVIDDVKYPSSKRDIVYEYGSEKVEISFFQICLYISNMKSLNMGRYYT